MHCKASFFPTNGTRWICHCWTSQSFSWSIMTWWTGSTTLDVWFQADNRRTSTSRLCFADTKGEPCNFIFKAFVRVFGWGILIFSKRCDSSSVPSSTWGRRLAKPNTSSPIYCGTLTKKSLELGSVSIALKIQDRFPLLLAVCRRNSSFVGLVPDAQPIRIVFNLVHWMNARAKSSTIAS